MVVARSVFFFKLLRQPSALFLLLKLHSFHWREEEQAGNNILTPVAVHCVGKREEGNSGASQRMVVMIAVSM